ncbi:hypothetical protein [Chryseobacterium taichungense]|uniref:hypothetical protein n=1 Tax=Chryseobacterium taichungense TaxID=295069 RepID=UPI0015A5F72E|nr:hypothetical protein [Chryseobacterium taichungense]
MQRLLSMKMKGGRIKPVQCGNEEKPDHMKKSHYAEEDQYQDVGNEVVKLTTMKIDH